MAQEKTGRVKTSRENRNRGREQGEAKRQRRENPIWLVPES